MDSHARFLKLLELSIFIGCAATIADGARIPDRSRLDLLALFEAALLLPSDCFPEELTDAVSDFEAWFLDGEVGIDRPSWIPYGFRARWEGVSDEVRG